MPKYTDVTIHTRGAWGIFDRIFESSILKGTESQRGARKDLWLLVARFLDKGLDASCTTGYFQENFFLPLDLVTMSLKSLENELIRQSIWYRIETCDFMRQHELCGCVQYTEWSLGVDTSSGQIMCRHCTDGHMRSFKSVLPETKKCAKHKPRRWLKSLAS